MNLSVQLKDIDRLLKVYDPEVVEKAAYSTIKQLQAKSATAVSKAVRSRYKVSASAIKSVLKQRIRMQGAVPSGYLIYVSRRISLRHFATKARPRVKTARGVRYGAKTKLYVKKSPEIVPGGFFGQAKDSGSGKIFQRKGRSRHPIKKRTAPSIAQMVSGEAPIRAINRLMQDEGDAKFAQNLDHFLQRKIGLR